MILMMLANRMLLIPPNDTTTHNELMFTEAIRLSAHFEGIRRLQFGESIILPVPPLPDLLPQFLWNQTFDTFLPD